MADNSRFSKIDKKPIKQEIERLESIYTEEEQTLLIQFLLHKRESKMSSKSNQIYMRMVVTEATFRHIFAVSDDVYVKDLVVELINIFDLPVKTPNSCSISYRLFARKWSGEYSILIDDATLSQQNIDSQCEFVLFPDVEF